GNGMATAIAFAREGARYREHAGHPDQPRLATVLNDLALLSKEQGHYAAAERLHKRGLDIAEKAHGPDQPFVAAALNNLAGVCWVQGRQLTHQRKSRNRLLQICNQKLRQETGKRVYSILIGNKRTNEPAHAGWQISMF